MTKIDEGLDIMMDYAMRMLFVPYKWGGASPLEGLDCSGFVQECLASIGKDPRGDQTAMGLYNALLPNTREDVIRYGSILFFGPSKKEITHTAIAYNDKVMIEAGGGGSKTLTFEDAKKHQAFVRIRPIRSDLVAFRNLY